MKTTIELYETPKGLRFIVNIAGIVKEFLTSSGAHKWLESLGYRYDFETGEYEKVRKGEKEQEIEYRYKICPKAEPTYTK